MYYRSSVDETTLVTDPRKKKSRNHRSGKQLHQEDGVVVVETGQVSVFV